MIKTQLFNNNLTYIFLSSDKISNEVNRKVTYRKRYQMNSHSNTSENSEHLLDSDYFIY